MNVSNTNPITSSVDLYEGATAPAQLRRITNAVRAVSEANIFGENRELTFSVDRITQRVIIRVIDRDTRETVMQLPPEYVLRLAANVHNKAP